MAADLIDWISRLASISGDARNEMISAARRGRWDFDSFGALVTGDPQLQRPLMDYMSPFELAKLQRAWRTDFGAPRSPPPAAAALPAAAGAPAPAPGAAAEGRRHYVGGDVLYEVEPYSPGAGADVFCSPDSRAERPSGRRPTNASGPARPGAAVEAWGSPVAPRRLSGRGQAGSPSEASSVRSVRSAGSERSRRSPPWSGEAAEQEPRPGGRGPVQPGAPPPLPELRRQDAAVALAVAFAAGRRSPGAAAEWGGGGAAWQGEELVPADLSGACALAASPDGGSVFAAGADGLAKFELPSLQLVAYAPCGGGATTRGYSDVAVAEDSVVCTDLEGTLYEHDPVTCELRMQRAYQPSVVETGHRVVASRVQSYRTPVVGLQGGPGGASRVAVTEDAVYLGGRDGVVTAYARAGGLNVLARARLSDSPVALGVRAVYLGPSRRLYCGVLSTVQVLSTPGLQTVAKLQGGPRVPVFGSICSLVESPDGAQLFAGDTGGPSVHMWDTATWQWLLRVELAEGGGAASHLAIPPGGNTLYATTECGRLLAFRLGRLPPLCIEEGGGGGPIATCPAWRRVAVVLDQQAGRLVLHDDNEDKGAWGAM